MKQVSTQEKGAVTIIEATFVFPIMFFIVFFMIMAGEAYYQRACVEYAVTSAAVNGAAKCENPMLKHVISDGAVPTDPTATDVTPYRYILTGEAKKIAGSVQSELTQKVSAFQPLLFRNMSPQNVSVKINLHMNPLISSFPVTCTFDVPFPIKFIFSDDTIKFHYTVQTTASIGDPSEFVRNVATVGDIIERSETASEIAGKMMDAMNKIGVYVN